MINKGKHEELVGLKRRHFSLGEIYQDILNEVFDLNQVKTYKLIPTHEGWKFVAKIQNEEVVVYVYVQPTNSNRFKLDNSVKNIANFGFEIGEERNTNQYKKTTFKDYIRILATVNDALLRFISHNNPDAILFFSDSKHGGTSVDIQKDDVYFAALEKNTPAGYEIENITDFKDHKSGIMLIKSKLKEINHKNRVVKLFINETDVKNREQNLKKNIMYMASGVNIQIENNDEFKKVVVTGKDVYLERLYEYFKKSNDITANILTESKLIMNFPQRLFE